MSWQTKFSRVRTEFLAAREDLIKSKDEPAALRLEALTRAVQTLLGALIRVIDALP